MLEMIVICKNNIYSNSNVIRLVVMVLPQNWIEEVVITVVYYGLRLNFFFQIKLIPT